MWFSKHFKLSKKQYEEARKADEFKLYSKEMWWNMIDSLQDIRHKFWINDYAQREEFPIYIPSKWLYHELEDKNESFFYFRLKNLIESIGDGWGRDYIRTETVYITNTFIISNASDHHEFIELDNGDLLVKEKIVTKLSDNKKITEIDTKRYKAGKWRKKIIESTYDKQLVDENDYATLDLAKDYCIKYEALCKVEGKHLEDNLC